jgi:hypothetical protein
MKQKVVMNLHAGKGHYSQSPVDDFLFRWLNLGDKNQFLVRSLGRSYGTFVNNVPLGSFCQVIGQLVYILILAIKRITLLAALVSKML